MIFRLKRCIARNKFVNSDAECPKIDSFIIATSKVDLRSKEKVSANDGKHISPCPPQKGFLGYAKINNFYFAIFLIIKNIFRFDIPMTDIM